MGEADGWKERETERERASERELKTQQHNGAFIRFVLLLLVSDLSI